MIVSQPSPVCWGPAQPASAEPATASPAPMNLRRVIIRVFICLLRYLFCWHYGSRMLRKGPRSQDSSGSIDLYMRFPDDLRPLGRLQADVGGEFVGRVADDEVALRDNTLLHLRRVHRPADIAVQL